MSRIFDINIVANHEYEAIIALEDIIASIRDGHYEFSGTVRGNGWDYNLSSQGEWTIGNNWWEIISGKNNNDTN